MNRIKSFFSTVLAFVLVACPVCASDDAAVHASLDSMMLWVGQQTGLHIEVSCDRDQEIEFPLFSDTIVRGLEIVPPVVTDTQLINGGKRMTVTRTYIVTCFDSALIFIPPLPVKVDGEEFQSDALALSFQTFEIPEGHEKELFPPKENMDARITAAELKLPLLFLFLAVACTIVGLYLFQRYRDNKPIIRKIKLEPKVPAHVRALGEIESLRQSGSAHDQDPKAYYTRLTDILRTYIDERFGFNAMEMTSDQIIENLENHPDHALLDELKGLLSTADMVKFAKVRPLLGENDRNLLGAVEFVKETQLELTPDELNPKLEETVVEERRSKEAGIAILSVCLVLGAAAVTMAVLFFVKVYYLFF